MDILETGLNILEQAAPTIASMLGGPLAGQGVAAIEGVLGLTPATGQSLEDRKNAALTALAGATPDQLLALKKEDNRHAEVVQQLGLDLEKQEDANVQGARDMQTATKTMAVPVIAGGILIGFFLISAAGLWGAFQLVTGTYHLDPTAQGLAVAGAGLIGTIIGYFATQAQTVVTFYFGSSHASAAKTDQMATNMQGFLELAAKQASGKK